MKKLIYKKIFPLTLIFFGFFSFVVFQQSASAQGNVFNVNLQALGSNNSPGAILSQIQQNQQNEATPAGITGLFKKYFTAMMGLVGISAFFMITWGGMQYASSGGNPSAISAAKEKIWGAVFGLILAAFSVLILKTINPDLVSFKISTPTNSPCQGPNGVYTDCTTGRTAGSGSSVTDSQVQSSRNANSTITPTPAIEANTRGLIEAGESGIRSSTGVQVNPNFR